MNDQPSTFHNLSPEQQSSPSSNYPRSYGSEPWQQPRIPFPIQPPPDFPPNGPGAYLKAMTLPLQLQPSRFAPVGLILGIVGFIVSLGVFSGAGPLFPFSFAFGCILSTAGIVFSALSLKSISRKALAIIGLVLSIITFSLLLLVTLIGILAGALAAPH